MDENWTWNLEIIIITTNFRILFFAIRLFSTPIGPFEKTYKIWIFFSSNGKAEPGGRISYNKFLIRFEVLFFLRKNYNFVGTNGMKFCFTAGILQLFLNISLQHFHIIWKQNVGKCWENSSKRKLILELPHICRYRVYSWSFIENYSADVSQKLFDEIINLKNESSVMSPVELLNNIFIKKLCAIPSNICITFWYFVLGLGVWEHKEKIHFMYGGHIEYMIPNVSFVITKIFIVIEI